MEGMTVPGDARATLHALIDSMTEAQAEDLLDYLNMLADPDELTPEEVEAVRQAMGEFERGETIPGEQLERELGIKV